MVGDLATAHMQEHLDNGNFSARDYKYFSLNGLEKRGRRLVLIMIWLLGLLRGVGYLWLLMDLRMRIKHK